jgi:hypothetical protein
MKHRKLNYSGFHFFPIILLILPLLFLGLGCNKTPTFNPYIPPFLYNSIEIKPGQLEQEYYGNYAYSAYADNKYGNQPFVFKNVTITKEMLIDKRENCIWVGVVKCVAMNQSDTNRLKVGIAVDVAGMNRGIIPGNALLMDSCIFIPVGQVEFPIQGSGATFVPSY